MYKSKVQFQHSDIEFNYSFKQLASYLNIPESIFDAYKSEFTLYEYKTGQVIYYSTNQIKLVYFLVNGSTLREVSDINGDTYINLNREEALFPIHHLFNETSTLYETYTALTDCKIMTFPKELLEFLCKTHEEIFVTLFKNINKMMYRQTEYGIALKTPLAKERIEKILNFLCRTIGEDNGGFYEIHQVMTIQLLSNLSGLSRETTSHVINELKDKNILFKNDKNWIIKK
ncbi:Crp/Fnr family transcriptional regulator [Staphylococcus simiae]|uniref:Crp/Fnr family transcriptional regulator n=1 Tax=Staphylococcus simiae TaxID=308354 RepID=UPI000B94B3AD|nr:Crp/Fnr family transcriptional regulator [Staphylococcus simiae]PNZ13221.1 Crp/Fnr family transcriptional regulator [Staphylococcus simiae]SNV54911.1 Transcriptional regulator ArcR essential for anaerobic expression of the ADI pathway, Crp/Fnr family [Staphylococcus simiae]